LRALPTEKAPSDNNTPNEGVGKRLDNRQTRCDVGTSSGKRSRRHQMSKLFARFARCSAKGETSSVVTEARLASSLEWTTYERSFAPPFGLSLSGMGQ
jgi:hypothetical protein